VIRCGIVITVAYGVIVAFLLLPAWSLLAHNPPRLEFGMYGDAGVWIGVAIPVAAQALLLFLSVDPTPRIFRQRRHVAFTAALVGLLTMVLFASAGLSLWLALRADPLEGLENPIAWSLLALAALWLLWAGLFYVYYRGSSRPVDGAVRWLLKGSVLELLVAVPSHIVVHRRNECTEPAVTAYGVVTGLALMLLAFGPGVLALYKKRIDERRARMQRARA
jgi:hypothetical protein